MIKVEFDIKYLNLDFIEQRFIVYDKDGEYYYILDSSDKIDDVSKMPHYIKDDFYKYNSKILTLKDFNTILERYKVRYSLVSHELGNKLKKDIRNFTDEENLQIQNIKRELKLRNLIDKNNLKDFDQFK